MSNEIQSEYLATKAGSFIAVGSGVSGWLIDHAQVFSVLGVIAGIAMAVSGLVFQFRRDRRETELQRKQIQLVNKSLEDQA